MKLSHPCALEHHLPRRVVMAVDDHAYLALELDNLKDWGPTNISRRREWYGRIRVLPHSSHARSSPPQKTRPSCRKAAHPRPRPQRRSVCRTSASSPGVQQQLFTWSSVIISSVPIAPPLQITWKELTGDSLTGVLAGAIFGGVGSGGGAFCCTARLWLATASCKAFSTFEVIKAWGLYNIILKQCWRRGNTLPRIHWVTNVAIINRYCCIWQHNIPFSPVMKGGWPKLKSYTTSCPFPSLDPVPGNISYKLWIVIKCEMDVCEGRICSIIPVLCCVLKSSSGGQRPWPGFPGLTASGRSHCRAHQYISFNKIETHFSEHQHSLSAHSRFTFSSLLTLKAWNPDPCRPWQAVPRVLLRWCNVAVPLCTFSMSRGSALKR